LSPACRRASIIGGDARVPLILSAIFCQLAAVMLLKYHATLHPEAGIKALLGEPLFWAALAALGAQAVFWQHVLGRHPLSFAYPLNSLIYPLGLLAGWFVFGEAITSARVAGAAAILAGAWLIADGSSR